MKKIALALLLISSYSGFTQTKTAFPDDLIITPEKSNFDKTSTYSDVMNFINDEHL